MTLGFLTVSLDERRQRNHVSKMLKEKNFEPKIYIKTNPFKHESRIKNILRDTKLQNFFTIEPPKIYLEVVKYEKQI